VYSNGIIYNIFVPFLYSWYSSANHIFHNNRWLWLEEPIPFRATANNAVLATQTRGVVGIYNRRIQWVRVFFSTGISIDVEFDHVLAHCEPCYASYGWAGHTAYDCGNGGPQELHLCTAGYDAKMITKANGWQCQSVVYDDLNDSCRVSLCTGDIYTFGRDALPRIMPEMIGLPTVACRVGKGSVRGCRVRLEDPTVNKIVNSMAAIIRFLKNIDYRFSDIAKEGMERSPRDRTG